MTKSSLIEHFIASRAASRFSVSFKRFPILVAVVIVFRFSFRNRQHDKVNTFVFPEFVVLDTFSSLYHSLDTDKVSYNLHFCYFLSVTLTPSLLVPIIDNSTD